MQEYYPLFLTALIFTFFASIQDLRKREVANWLNFSLLTFALAYRLIYSIYFDKYYFLFYGLVGFAIFFGLANLFYYSKVFAGGDAKLLMAFGVVIPFNSLYDLIALSVAFIFVLFTLGAIYSVFYSIIISINNLDKFKRRFPKELKTNKKNVLLGLGLAIILYILTTISKIDSTMSLYGIILLIFMPFIYIYLKTVENSCLIRLVSPQDLTEGDWLEKEVRIDGKMIKRSVHGLNIEEIRKIRKANKKVWIKYGVPFVPAFLFALVFMVLFYSFSGLAYLHQIFYLF